MASTVTFTVAGEQAIHCAGCEQRIGNALKRLSGVQQVDASAKTQQVIVRFDPGQVTETELRAKLEQAGFAATPMGERT